MEHKMNHLVRITISVILFGMIFYFIPIFLSSFKFIRSIPGNTPMILTEFGYLIFSFIAILIISKFNLKEYGFKVINVKELAKPLSLVIGWTGALFFLVHFVWKINVDLNYLIYKDKALLQVFVVLVLLPSVSEELFIRGLIQSYLYPLIVFKIRIFKVLISVPVILSALFFVLLHLWTLYYMDNFYFFLGFFTNILIVGILAAYYREKTGSLILPIAIHFLANFINILLPLVIFQ